MGEGKKKWDKCWGVILGQNLQYSKLDAGKISRNTMKFSGKRDPVKHRNTPIERT